MIDTLGYDVSRPIYLPDPVNRQHELNQGKVAWWLTVPGLDGGRYLYDLMGLFRGTLTSMGAGSGWKGTTRPGGFGHLVYDGTDDFISSGLVQPSPPFSIFAWVYPAGSVARAIVGASVTSGIELRIDGAQTLSLLKQNTSNIFTSAATVPNGSWSRVGAVYDGNNWGIYINGILTDSGLSAQSFVSATTLIGKQNFGEQFSGNMDDVSIWNRLLSARDARTDYDLSRLGYPGLLNRIGPTLWSVGVGGVVSPLPRRVIRASVDWLKYAD
jgi:hypothetical protein